MATNEAAELLYCLTQFNSSIRAVDFILYGGDALQKDHFMAKDSKNDYSVRMSCHVVLTLSLNCTLHTFHLVLFSLEAYNTACSAVFADTTVLKAVQSHI